MRRYHYFIYLNVAWWQKRQQRTRQNYACKATDYVFLRMENVGTRRNQYNNLTLAPNSKFQNTTTIITLLAV